MSCSAGLVAGDGVHGVLARDGEGTAVGFVHWLYHPSTWSIGPYCYLEEDLFVAAGRARWREWARAHRARPAARRGRRRRLKVYWQTRATNATARTLYDKVADLSGFVHYQIEL